MMTSCGGEPGAMGTVHGASSTGPGSQGPSYPQPGAGQHGKPRPRHWAPPWGLGQAKAGLQCWLAGLMVGQSRTVWS